MCVGCRERANASSLIRVVAVEGRVIPDPPRRLPGRGAHVHPAKQCLDRAERSKALSRALRVVGKLDVSALREAVDVSLARPFPAPAGDERHRRGSSVERTGSSRMNTP
jgi:predicted RNA-binding protein YlxR (DUF448 family)